MYEKEKLFLELIEGFKWRYDLDKNKNSLFLFKNEKDIIQFFNKSGISINQRKMIASYRLGIKQDLKGSMIITNKEFRLNFDMSQEEYKKFIVDMMNKHFKIKIVFWYSAA
jgi:hypothetical protein